MRVCTKCGIEKDETEFYLVSATGKPRAQCKRCHNVDFLARQKANPEKYNARSRAWREANPGRASAISRAWQLRHPEKAKAVQIRGLFKIDFHRVWNEQSGLCACCLGPMIREGREPNSVCVDHDRTCCPGKKSCGKCVRGLIHRNCNLVLGYAKDNVDVLRCAVRYLESWRTQSRTISSEEQTSKGANLVT